jgi:hypothetical protein
MVVNHVVVNDDQRPVVSAMMSHHHMVMHHAVVVHRLSERDYGCSQKGYCECECF